MAKFDFFKKQKNTLLENSYKKVHAKNLRQTIKTDWVSGKDARACARNPKFGYFWATVLFQPTLELPILILFKNKKIHF